MHPAYRLDYGAILFGLDAFVVALRWMTGGTSSSEESANLYRRGVDEGRAGELLDGETLLAILDAFCEGD